MAFDSKRRPGRGALLSSVLVAVVLALVLAAYFYDHSRGGLIAPGVKIAGLNVGRLKAQAARARLRAELRSTQSDWITVRYGTLRVTLSGTQAHLTADVDGAVTRAVTQSRGGWFLSRAVRDLTGGGVDSEIPLPVSYRSGAVEKFIGRVQSAIDRPARDASLTVDSGAQLVTVRSHDGVAVDSSALRGELVRALRAPTIPHVLRASRLPPRRPRSRPRC